MTTSDTPLFNHAFTDAVMRAIRKSLDLNHTPRTAFAQTRRPVEDAVRHYLEDYGPVGSAEIATALGHERRIIQNILKRLVARKEAIYTIAYVGPNRNHRRIYTLVRDAD